MRGDPQRQLTPDEERERSRAKYSKWHRPPTLPHWCYMVDMDWVEMRVVNRELIPVAFVECITYRGENIEEANIEKPLTRAKKALCEYCEKNWLPTYVVWFNPDKLGEGARFLVQRINSETPLLMTEEGYKDFIKNLQARR